MKRALKIVALTSVILVLLVLVVAAWILVDDDFLRGRVEHHFLKATGRPLTIESLDIEPGSTLILTATNLRLANAGWATAGNLAEVDELLVALDARSLLKGDLSIIELSVAGTRINAQQDETGRNNWNLFPAAEGQEKRGEARTLSWRNVNTTDLKFTLSSPGRASPLEISVTSLEASQSGAGHMGFEARGEVSGYPLEMNGFVDPMHAFYQGGSVSHELSAALGDIRFHSQGVIADARTGAGAQIDTRFHGPDFAWLLDQAALPPFSSGAFDVGISLNVSDQGDLLLDLDGDLGSFTAFAEGKVDRLIGPSTIDLDFDIKGPGLTALGGALGVDGLPDEPYEFSGRVLLDNGTLSVERFEALVSKDRLSITGKVGKWPELSGTELLVDASGRDIRAWEEVIGLGEWNPNPFSLSGRFSEKGGMIHLGESHAQVGNNSLAVDGVLGPPPRMLGSDFRLKVEIPDLGAVAGLREYAFTRELPVHFDGSVRRSERGLEITDGAITSTRHRLGLDGLIALQPSSDGLENAPWYAKLTGSHLQASLATPDAGALTQIFNLDSFPGMPLELRADFDLSGDGLSYRARTNDTENVSVDIEGNLPNPGALTGGEADFDISMPNLLLLESMGNMPELPDHPVSARGAIHFQPGFVKVKQAKGTIGSADFNLQAEFITEPGFGVGSAQFSATGPDFREFYDHAHLTGLPREFAIIGELKPADEALQLEGFSVALGQTRLGWSGTVDRFPGVGDFDLQVSVDVPDPDDLEGFLAHHGLNRYPEDPVSMKLAMRGSPDSFEFPMVQLDIGKSSVNGQATVSLVPIPEIHGAFSAETVDLAWLKLIPQEATGGTEAGERAEPETEAAAARSDVRFFSDEPLSLIPIKPMVVDLRFDFSEIILGEQVFTDTLVGIVLTDSILKLDPFRLTDKVGGHLDGTASLTRNGESVDANIRGIANGLRIGLTADPSQPLSIYPPWDIFVDLEASGSSRREMAATADGQLHIIVGEGQVLNNRLNIVFSDIISELLNTLNPFSKSSDHTQVDCGVLVLNVGEAQARLDPLILQTDRVVTTSQGVIDLKTEKINLGFNTRPRKGIGLSAGAIINPFIKLGGTLSKPSVVLDAGDATIQGGAAVATGGLTLIGKSLFDRFLRDRDPCGKVVAELRSREEYQEGAN